MTFRNLPLIPSLGASVAGAGILVAITRAVANDSYHWDIDHEIYFGSRLLNGELIWISEFQDKLPVVQFFFAIPAFFGSEKAWVAINLLAIFVAVLVFIRTPLTILSPDIRGSAFGQVGGPKVVGILVFLAVIAFSPNGPSHISALPASLVLIALTVVLSLRDRLFASISPPSLRAVLPHLLMPTFCGAVAISFRPYLLIPLAVVILWLLIEISGIGNSWRYAWLPLGLVTLTFAWGVLLNAGPYILTGHFDGFITGAAVLAEDLNPMNGLSRMLSSPTSLGILSLSVLFLVVGLFLLPKISRSQRIGLVFSISSIALWAAISQVHWWSHYGPLFAPFLALAGSWAIAKSADFSWSKAWRVAAIPSIAGSVAILVGGVSLSTNSWGTQDFLDGKWPSASEKDDLAKEVASALPTTNSAGRDFLYVENMHAHWFLREGRHGFPHAANSLQIRMGWWYRLIPPESAFLFPTTEYDLCEFLKDNGPSSVITETNSLIACLEESDVYLGGRVLSNGAVVFSK